MNLKNNTEVFLSYCSKNDKIANSICGYFMKNRHLKLHRDIIDIKPWESISMYMQSIRYADYIIILISDEYLKSRNCMYEALTVMQDSDYANKIFPVVINMKIYKPINRVGYIKYWEKEYHELENAVAEVSIQNIGRLDKELKLLQEISSNIEEFLEVISDMNNPQISDVAYRIEEVLLTNGII